MKPSQASPGDRCILFARSQKGRDRVRRFDPLRTVEAVRENPPCAMGRHTSGPWLLLVDESREDPRWVHSTDDRDFSVNMLVNEEEMNQAQEAARERLITELEKVRKSKC